MMTALTMIMTTLRSMTMMLRSMADDGGGDTQAAAKGPMMTATTARSTTMR